MAATSEPDSPPQDAPDLRPVRRSVRLSGLRTIVALILREMTSRYGRSPGGYLWIVLEPAIGILFMVLLFMAMGLRSPALGSNFAMFFATGILPFAMYADISGKVSQSINFSKALLAFPRVTFVDAIIARCVLAVLTQLLVGFILLTAIRMIFDTRTTTDMSPILLSYLMAIAFGLGIGLMNCFLATRFEVWQQVWSIVNRPLFLLSGILIIYESIPPPWGDYLLWNPLMHITAEMRTGFYVGYDAVYVDPLYVFGVSLVIGLFGMIFLYRYHRDMLEV